MSRPCHPDHARLVHRRPRGEVSAALLSPANTRRMTITPTSGDMTARYFGHHEHQRRHETCTEGLIVEKPTLHWPTETPP